MDKEEKKRYIVLFLAFLLILRVLSCNIVSQSPKENKPRCKPMNNEKEISIQETNEFLKLWAEYVEKGYNKKVSDKISLMDGGLEEHLPLSVKLWFNGKCWTAERFYYIEDRLRASIQTLYLKRHSASILAILNERMSGGDTSEYQNFIDMQNKIANIENISEKELDYVQMREAEIVNILNMK